MTARRSRPRNPRGPNANSDLAALIAAASCEQHGCACIPGERLTHPAPGVLELVVEHDPWCPVLAEVGEQVQP